MVGGSDNLFVPRQTFERRAIPGGELNFSEPRRGTTGKSCRPSRARARWAREQSTLARTVSQGRFIPKSVWFQQGHQKGPGIAKSFALKELRLCARAHCYEEGPLRGAEVVVDLARPHIRVRAGAAKGNRPRVVPLWWDEGTLRDLAAWKSERIGQGAKPDEPFVGCQNYGRFGTPLLRYTLRKRFRTACRVLDAKRIDRTPTCISHALAGGRTLAQVRDAAGHANVSVSSRYLHVALG